MEEQWRPVADFEDRYEVSSLGRVRSWVNQQRNRRTVPLILKPAPDSSGHLQVSLRRDLLKTQVRVHVLVARAFVGTAPEGAEVRHLDGDQLNNHASNLAWGTHAENMADMAAHGTSVGHAKLTQGDVVRIRSRWASGESLRQIARDFPRVLEVTVRRAAHGVFWQHV